MEAPTFSLHTVAGVLTNATLLLRVVVGAASLVALVDTGSTHKFIGEEAALRTGLHIQPRPRLTATVANGDKVACPGVLRRTAISIDDLDFSVDLYVMPLTGYDMVLGTQWMAPLEHIT
jgi:predicted aspartyl protease